MNKEEKLYQTIGYMLKDAEKGQMFGKQCLKINGKAFASLFHNDMVFKLSGEDHKEALSLDGSQSFDPSGKGRAMKEWIQVPYDYKDDWEKYAISALNYVLTKYNSK